MPEIPAGATKPDDHKKTAAQIEAEGIETVTVADHNGHTYTFPSDPQDWPVKAARSFEEGHAIGAIRILIGAKEYDAQKIDRWTNRQLNALFEKFAEAAGLETSGN